MLHKNYRGDTWQATRAFGYTSFGFNMGSSCQLNLTLASSVSQSNPYQENDTIPQSFEDIGKPPSENVPSNSKPTNNAAPAAPTAVPTLVNDVFWEQFLTERPGSSEMLMIQAQI
ncbi:hypothetical protein Tco_0998840 [Tanacetum coccineum]